MKSKFADIIEAAKAECERRGMKVLPPLTEQDRINKSIEINARQAIKTAGINLKRELTEEEKRIEQIKQAEAVELFYANARKKD